MWNSEILWVTNSENSHKLPGVCWKLVKKILDARRNANVMHDFTFQYMVPSLAWNGKMGEHFPVREKSGNFECSTGSQGI